MLHNYYGYDVISNHVIKRKCPATTQICAGLLRKRITINFAKNIYGQVGKLTRSILMLKVNKAPLNNIEFSFLV